MRGTGPVRLNQTTVYGFYRVDAGTLRLRLSCDEWDVSGLHQGQRVTVALPNAGPEDLLILTVARTPPFVWVEMRA